MPDAWNYTRADTLSHYKPGSSLTFIETFRDYELTNTPGFRRFAVLGVGQKDALAVAGVVIFAEIRGDRGAVKAASKIVSSLTTPSFQKAAGLSGKWLAANGEAPEIDGTGASVRNLVRQARAFYPLTDRLPDPLIKGNLLDDIQLAIDTTPRK